MQTIVTVKFRDAGRHYFFRAPDFEISIDDQVVVETDRGKALATIVQAPREISEADLPDDLKSVLRLATEEDLSLAATNADREEDALRYCLERVKSRKMEMKLVRAEYLFDGSKIIFYFTAEGRIDFRELVKDLAHHFHTRIEMRQIGVRDEAKLTGGIGICGRELCCCTWLTDFAPVSVKMAKEQGLALNPTKISGQCGRLLCCLGYEFETYCAHRKGLPNPGKRVLCQGKEGVVVDQNVLCRKVRIRLEDGQTLEATPEDLERGTSPPRADSAEGQPSERKSGPRPGKPDKDQPPGKAESEPSQQAAEKEQKPQRRRRRRNRGRRRPKQD